MPNASEPPAPSEHVAGGRRVDDHCQYEHGKLRLEGVIAGGGAAVTVVLIVVSVAWLLVQGGVTKAEAAAARADAAASAAVVPLREEVRENKREAASVLNRFGAELTEIRWDIRAADDARRTGRPAPRLQLEPAPLPQLDSGSP